ncbi:hypothetical protein BWQ96_02391 [Gracilariopsis chorda]|uniref:Uncharacterized protein n=1 Tax=Gracilariopsis chorda TaxID=448386 RepID=A0A2V3J034_9FLOR|nr:hypothetical protein BWQ96_02391 [Gracilariopsis chorda]|eukprot:PXF47709.1 hypothetical protein BWQ96_02391 [Gracilariopsis chorda]
MSGILNNISAVCEEHGRMAIPGRFLDEICGACHRKFKLDIHPSPGNATLADAFVRPTLGFKVQVKQQKLHKTSMEQRQFERKRKAPWAEDNEPGHLIPAPESGQEVRTAMEYLDLKLMEMKREKTKRPSAYIKPTEKQVTVMKRLQNAKSSRFCHILYFRSEMGLGVRRERERY